MKICIKSAYAISNYILALSVLFFWSATSIAQTGKIYAKGEKSLSELLNETNDNHVALSSSISAYNKDYTLDGSIVGFIDSISNTKRNTYVNSTMLKLIYIAYEYYLNQYWYSVIYGPSMGEVSYLDGLKLLVKDTLIYDYNLIPKEKKTDAYMAENLYCYEQIIPINTSIENASNIMIGDLYRFFQSKNGTYIKPSSATVQGYFIRRVNNLIITEKEVRTRLKHLGRREYQSSKDITNLIDQFFRPRSAEVAGVHIPYVFDEDSINGTMEIIMPVWKVGDKLEDFILALNTNGLEFIMGEKNMAKILVFDDLSIIGL